MNINRITLFNYGPFCEKNSISFPNPHETDNSGQKNIVLVGGKNGSGKTSLFTAIQVCLYGQSSLGLKTSRKEYEEFLKDQIHKRANTLFIVDTSYIEVDFDFSVSGHTDNYFVKRTWVVEPNGGLAEALAVKKNGVPLEIYEENYWQEFINYLIPHGLLKLFFFDGERINALTKDNANIELGNSIQALFGIELIRQLIADLKYFVRKKAKGQQKQEICAGLSEIDNAIKAIEEEYEHLFKESGSLNTNIDNLRNRSTILEAKLRSFGGTFLDSRERIKERIEALDLALEERTRELKNLFIKELPFYYAGEYLAHTAERIKLAENMKSDDRYKAEFDKRWNASKRKIERFLRNKKDVIEIYGQLVGNALKTNGKQAYDAISEKDLKEIAQWFALDVRQQKEEALRIGNEIENMKREHDSLAKKLEYIPEKEDFSSYLEEMMKIYAEEAQVKALLASLENRMKQNRDKIAERKRQKTRLEVDLMESDRSNRKMEIVSKSISALEKFESELIKSKIKALEDNILLSLSRLLRKTDKIRKVKIDKGEFDIVLEDALGRRIDKKGLSEGEKQIYSVSLLSGITKTSKRAFPVFFDTPLGRLDSDHRMNIIHNFFPVASHQMIILSTDTEIDRQYFEELRPYLSSSFLLEFDPENKYTNIIEGYFWK